MRSLAAIEGTAADVQTRQALRELQVKMQSLENLLGRIIKNGTVTVRVNDLQDTNTKNLADNMILQYDAPTQQYVATSAAALGGVDAETLDGIDSLGFVQTAPAAGQTVTQPSTAGGGQTVLTVESDDPTRDGTYKVGMEISRLGLLFGGDNVSGADPTTPAEGHFILYARQLFSPGTGSSVFRLMDDTGEVYRLDNKFPVIAQDNGTPPTTDGTYLIWISTNNTPGPSDLVYYLLSGSWEFSGIAN